MLPLVCFADNSKWQEFENNLYIGTGYSSNNAQINQFGTQDSSSAFGKLGMNVLLNNQVYTSLELTDNLVKGGSYVNDWLNGVIKFGYSIQTNNTNFIPYLVGGYGNQGAYYSTASNYSYGAGVLSEYMINANWLLYVDANYQVQNFANSVNEDFNNNVVNNRTNYQLSGASGDVMISLGIKHITAGGWYFNPFFKYENFSQTFVQNVGQGINYGTLTPTTNQFQVGINVGVEI